MKAIGAGVNEWPVCEILLGLGDFDCFLLAGRYTLLEQEALDSFLPLCEKRDVGIILGGPFNSGILATGADRRRALRLCSRPPEILERVRRIEAICHLHGVRLIEAALQFVLGHPAVKTVIPGANAPDQVDRQRWPLECQNSRRALVGPEEPRDCSARTRRFPTIDHLRKQPCCSASTAILNPELLMILRAMGHGDEIAIVDANYPGEEQRQASRPSRRRRRQPGADRGPVGVAAQLLREGARQLHAGGRQAEGNSAGRRRFSDDRRPSLGLSDQDRADRALRLLRARQDLLRASSRRATGGSMPTSS